MPSKPLPKPVSARTLQKKYIQLAETTRGRIDIATDSGSRISSLLHRMIINKKLISRGYYRFHDFCVLMDSPSDKPYAFLTKEKYRAWADPDHFRKSFCARDMLRFLENLRVSNDSKNLDVDGHPIHGKTLNKFIFWNSNDRFLYNYTSLKWEKEAFANEEPPMVRCDAAIHRGFFCPDRDLLKRVPSAGGRAGLSGPTCRTGR
mgnify:CR=1 FL=1